MSTIINLYPDAPNTLLWRNHDLQTKREFFPSVSIRFEDMPEWHECTEADRIAYEAEWSAKHPEEFIEEYTEVAEQERKANDERDAQV